MRANTTLLLALLASLVFAWRASAQCAVVSLQAGVAPFEGQHELEIGARFSPVLLWESTYPSTGSPA